MDGGSVDGVQKFTKIAEAVKYVQPFKHLKINIFTLILIKSVKIEDDLYIFMQFRVNI